MSLIASLSREFRADAPQFDTDEFRATTTGALNLFHRQTKGVSSFISDDLKTKFGASFGNTVRIPVINNKSVSIRTTRPLIIPDDENTSALYTVTPVTFAYGFTMYPAQHYNNDIDYQRDFNAKYAAMIVAMSAAIEAAAEGAIDLAKTQVFNVVTGGHTVAGNVVSETGIASLKDSYILADLQPIMAGNDFPGLNLHILGNQGFRSVLNRLDTFGEFNEQNKTFMYQNNEFSFTNAISDATDKVATGYAIEPGQLGMVTRVEPDSEYRTNLPDGHQWGKVLVPGLELEFGTYMYREAVDASGLNASTTGLTRTSKIAMDFAIDIAFITKYNSNRATLPSGVLKFDIQTA
jgi:hypothetical protein